MELPAPLFDPKLEKIKKSNPPKNFRIFHETELSNPSIKKFILFSYIFGKGNHKKILYIP